MTMTNSHKRLELLHISILNGNFQLKQQLFSLLDALRSNVAVTSSGRLGTGAEAGTLVTRAPRGGGGAGPSAAVLQEQAVGPGAVLVVERLLRLPPLVLLVVLLK